MMASPTKGEARERPSSSSHRPPLLLSLSLSLSLSLPPPHPLERGADVSTSAGLVPCGPFTSTFSTAVSFLHFYQFTYTSTYVKYIEKTTIADEDTREVTTWKLGSTALGVQFRSSREHLASVFFLCRYVTVSIMCRFACLDAFSEALFGCRVCCEDPHIWVSFVPTGERVKIVEEWKKKREEGPKRKKREVWTRHRCHNEPLAEFWASSVPGTASREIVE